MKKAAAKEKDKIAKDAEKAVRMRDDRIADLERTLSQNEDGERRVIEQHTAEKQQLESAVDRFISERQREVEKRIAAEDAQRRAFVEMTENQRRVEQAEAARAEAEEAMATNPVVINKRLCDLMERDAKRNRSEATPRSEFANSGELKEKIDLKAFDFEGLSYLLEVKSRARDKIVNDEFVALGSLLIDSHNNGNIFLQAVEMRDAGYLTQNVPPPPPQIKSKLELFSKLFLFGSFYLQKHPGKAISFFDYLLFLMEHAETLTTAGLVQLDEQMRRDFAANPTWNWAQHRVQSTRIVQRIHTKDEFKISTYRSAKTTVGGRKPGNNSSGNSNFGKQKTSGYSGFKHQNSQSKPYGKKGNATRDNVKNECCSKFQDGSCKFGANCWRMHICVACRSAEHGRTACPSMKGAVN